MNKFRHQYKDDTFAWIECTYASIYEVYVELVKEIMLENEIKPIDDMALDVVIGGDHGLKAFCLAFRTIITMTNGKMYHRKYGGAALVAGKDTDDLLEAYIMPWLTEDLQAINKKRIVLETSKDGSISMCICGRGQ